MIDRTGQSMLDLPEPAEDFGCRFGELRHGDLFFRRYERHPINSVVLFRKTGIARAQDVFTGMETELAADAPVWHIAHQDGELGVRIKTAIERSLHPR